MEVPFRLETREAITVDGSFDAALQRLREHLLWLASPPGVLRSLEYRLADAERALRRAADGQEHARIADDIDWLKRQIVQQRDVIAHPEAAALRVQESVDRGLESERQPDVPARQRAQCRVVNPPPAVPPSYFQDRFLETRLLEDLVLDAGIRLVCLVGRGGVGKTAMVCRFLNAVENGQRSDGSGPLAADAIVYQSASGTRHISVAALFADLCTLLEEGTARELKSLYASPVATTAAKFDALFRAFGKRRVIVLLDNFEDLIDPEQSTIRDAELADALRAWLTLPPHALKLIITTRVAPRDVLVEQPARQARIDLDEGLPPPFAENILRAMAARRRPFGLTDTSNAGDGPPHCRGGTERPSGASHTDTVLPLAVASNFPSPLHRTALIPSPCSSGDANSSSSARLQIRSFLSVPTVTSRVPSGLNTTSLTEDRAS